MTDQSSFELIEEAIAGNKEAFEALCEQKDRSILYFCIHLMNDIGEGEDAAQEVILYMYRNIHALKSPEAFQVWMYRIVKGVCLNMKRSKSKKSDDPVNRTRAQLMEERNDFLPIGFLEDSSKQEKLLSIVYNLPFECKMCSLLFYYQGMSYKEIAAAMEINRKDVDHTLMKAKRLIQRKLAGEPGSRNLMLNLNGAVPLQIQHQLFELDMGLRVADSSLRRVRDGWKAAVRAGIEPALTGSMLTHSRKGLTAADTAVKVTLGVLVTAGVTAGLAGYYTNWNQTGPISSSVQAEHENPLTSPEAVGIDEEVDIKTLADMIGIEPELRLTGYREEGIADMRAVEDFLTELGMEAIENIWKPVKGQEDTLYALTRQGKMLLVVTRENRNEGGGHQLVFRFTDDTEELPEDIGISLCLEEW